MRKLLAGVFLLATSAWSQSYTASVRGTVTDASHAAVPNAKVTATDADRNVEYPTRTDAAGRYIFTTLPPARYTLTVEAPGFQKATEPPFRLEVQQQATLDVELAVGDVTTSVEVKASAPLLNTTSASLGQVVESRVFMSAPNQGRSPLSMVSVAPGITGAIGGVAFVSNGVRNNASAVLMDGGALTGIEQNGGITDVKYQPTVDVIEEFKVQTNFFSAEFGNTGGTVVNMVSKSGTNELHGVGYFFRRDNALNANSFFSNRNGLALVDSHRNNLGGTGGGPVYIPKLYNGKNRTFFFADFDGYKELGATSETASVPTAQQLSGDFSDTRLANGNMITIYNPFDTFKNAAGTTLRNPFLGNKIPLSMQNQITRNMDAYFPAPTSAGNAFTRVNNFFAQGSIPSANYKLDGKIDHNISDKQRFTARYSVNWGWSDVANLTGNISHNGNPGNNRAQQFVLDYTRTHSPTTIFNGRVGVTRVRSIRDPLSTGFDQTSLGFPKLIQYTGVLAFPRYQTTTYRAMGAGGFAVIHRFEDVYQATGSVTKIVGGHTLKAGAEYQLYHENYYQPNLPQGGFVFRRNETAANPLVGSSSQGDGLASALVGFGNGGALTIDYPTAQSSGYFGTFINDDWRITRRLTFNLGLRYDFDIPRTDRFNRLNWFDIGSPSPIRDQVKSVFPNLNGVMKFVDDNHKSPFDGDWNNVQPRFGFAFALNNKTSLRGAYGIFYTVSRHTIKGEVGSAFGLVDSSVQWTNDSHLTQLGTLQNPWPNGLTLPPGRNPLAFLGQDAGANFPHDDNPQYQQWNFSIQREVPGHGVVEVNYVGTKGTHLYFGTSDIVSDLNKLDPIYWGLGRDKLTSQVPNPFYRIITSPQAIELNGPTVELQRLLRAFPQYAGSIGGYRATPNIGNSMYHAAQFKYEKRFSYGLSMIAHYTISKMISDSDVAGTDVDFITGGSSIQNWKNLRLERSLSAFDVPQRAVISFDYLLPIGRSRTLGKSMNRILDGAIGGWELSSVITFSSGTPLAVVQSDNNLWEGDQRPNLIGNPSMPGSVKDRLNNYFNVKAFSAVPEDTYGSGPRTLNYRGPGLRNADLTMAKNFVIREHKSLQLRLEAYNVTNTTTFGFSTANANGAANRSFGDTSFGVISAYAPGRTPRQLQVALKFYY